MPTKIIREQADIESLGLILSNRKLPITVTYTQGARRTELQNRLTQRWYTDISLQLGDQSHEDVRTECKLRIGVPILRAENDAFRLSYDSILKHLTYAEKLDAIKSFDLPVTRLMTTKQLGQYVDEMQRIYATQGIRLTTIEDIRYEQEFNHEATE